MKIKLPILLYFDKQLYADDGIGLKAMGAKFTKKGTFLCKEHSLDEQPAWLIEVDGSFIELMPIGKRREWARPFSFLWRFTLSEFKVSPKRVITVTELQKKISKISDKYEEAQVAGDLRRHLKKYDPNELVTEKILRDWPI
jgi:hypothetical protein